VDRKREILAVHVGDQVRHADLCLQGRVRQVAPEADGILLAVIPFVVVVVVEATARPVMLAATLPSTAAAVNNRFRTAPARARASSRIRSPPLAARGGWTHRRCDALHAASLAPNQQHNQLRLTRSGSAGSEGELGMRAWSSSAPWLGIALSLFVTPPASAASWKVAFYNIQSGKGAAPLPGHTAPFVSNQNCTDPSQPLNAWGRGLIQDELRARLNVDPTTVALGLAEAWLCASPEHVRQALGWAARTDDRNGLAIVARYGFAGAVQWLQLDTSLNLNPRDTHWVLRAPVCGDAACSRPIVVYAAHWGGDGTYVHETFQRQAVATRDFMAQDAGRPHLLMGDLNVYESSLPGCGSAPPSATLQVLRDAGYLDTWPAVHGSEEGFTGMWNRAGCGVPQGYPFKRIDYVWLQGYQPAAMARFGMTTPGDGALSDHAGVLATITDGANPPADPREVVLYTASTATVAGAWLLENDPSAASGRRIRNPDAGAPKAAAAAAPADYFEMTFEALGGIPYHLWFRARADRDFYGNDSVSVQFSDSVTAAGAATARIGSTSAASMVLEDGPNAVIAGWGWQDNGYGPGLFGSDIYFAQSGTHTIRVQRREDGVAIDQIVLSAGRFLHAAPGAVRNDATILLR
jgi:endonuclease/exonuclease/phosphatase family metal-dependent hydrolase